MQNSGTQEETFIPLGILEKRISDLEYSLAGKTSLQDINFSKIKPILNCLHEVDTVFISNISGRKKINSLLKRVHMLQKVLDPSHLDSVFDTDMKVEVIIESENDIQNYTKNLNQLEKVNTALNNEIMLQLPSLDERLNSLVLNLMQIKKQCDRQAQELNELTRDYKDCIVEVSSLLAELHNTITRLEKEAEPKAVLD